MKKLFLFATLALICLMSEGQELKSVPSRFTYCEIVGEGTLKESRVNARLDFGETKMIASDEIYNDPKTGKRLTFSSMIDAMNFMASQGWDFVQGYAVAVNQTTGCIYHYILRKEIAPLPQQ